MTEKYIERISLHNFKRFRTLDIALSSGTNILIGDNDSGKSTILLAIELTLGGNNNRVESIGLDSLISRESVAEFYAQPAQNQTFENLPRSYVEIYLNDHGNMDLEGRNNSKDENCHGLFLELAPREDLKDLFDEILGKPDSTFPFEFYNISFRTFRGGSFTGYHRYARYLLIDNTQISNEYAMRSYVKNVYESHSNSNERSVHNFHYRHAKKVYGNTHLDAINKTLSEDHSFELKHGAKSTLENDLTISESGMQIENMGKGRQCFVRTEFALSRGGSGNCSDVTLLEEPENHLSHSNMNELIKKIVGANDSQLLVTTHSSLISARLDLRNAIFLSQSAKDPVLLNSLSPSTAAFFSKAPITNILEFSLSNKVILVEGAAEYILMAAFFRKVTGEDLATANVHVASVGGLSFKRYLEVAAILNISTAVITDNDGDYENNITEKYMDYDDVGHIDVYADKEPSNSTFEISMYLKNQSVCDQLFSERLKTNTVQNYMLANKSECAYELLLEKGDELNTPGYIEEAIKWINK